MRALMCTQFGPPDTLQVQECPTPKPGPGEVLLRVQAAGVNYPDALMVAGQYQVRPPLPFTPGAEAAGVIEALGDGVSSFTVGQCVAAFVGTGAFATHLLAPAAQVMPLPPGMPLPTAAVLPLAYGTSMHALTQRAQLLAGETLLVLGAAGGVGLAAVMIGKALGATVIAGVSTAEKGEVAQQAGADFVLNYGNHPDALHTATIDTDAGQDFRAKLKDLTSGHGPNVIFDPVGGDLSELAFRSITWEGRYLVVGFAGGGIPKLPLNLPLLKGASVMGVFWGEFTRRNPTGNAQNMKQLAGWVMSGQVTPLVSAQYALEHTPRALQALLDRQVTGKIVVTP